MNSDYFYFKQFKLRNRDSSFKVNTDGVLLAAWANVDDDLTVLDIGTGTGVIPLMLSQKNPNLVITAVEIQEDSYNEALFNFQLNDKRIEIHHCPVQEFAKSKIKFDHIVSNPPYFQNSTKPSISGLNTSKHNAKLSFESLWDSIDKLSHSKSIVSVIIPFDKFDKFDILAKALDYSLTRLCRVKSRAHTEWIRILLEYKKDMNNPVIEDEMYLQDEGRNNWSESYRKLTKDFYLNS